MAQGAWNALVWQTIMFRQAMVMADGEEPLDSDPFGLFDDQPSQRQATVAPYNPAVLEALSTVGNVV